MPRTGRGRWYEAVGGIGLELELDSIDPEYRWRIGCIIREQGKRPKVFIVRIDRQAESYDAPGYHRSLEEAKAEAMRIFRVTEIVEDCGQCKEDPCRCAIDEAEGLVATFIGATGARVGISFEDCETPF